MAILPNPSRLPHTSGWLPYPTLDHSRPVAGGGIFFLNLTVQKMSKTGNCPPPPFGFGFCIHGIVASENKPQGGGGGVQFDFLKTEKLVPPHTLKLLPMDLHSRAERQV